MTADDDLRRAAVALLAYTDAGVVREGALRDRLDALRVALAARSDITQAATGGPDFTPKEWPEPRAEGLRGDTDKNLPATHNYTHRWRCIDCHPDAATLPAEGLDVERLAGALRRAPKHLVVTGHDLEAAKAIADLYAALAPEQPR